MGEFLKNAVFLLVSAVVILPTPTLVFAYMTGKTFIQVLYR